jgi:hypothetical protein
LATTIPQISGLVDNHTLGYHYNTPAVLLSTCVTLIVDNKIEHNRAQVGGGGGGRNGEGRLIGISLNCHDIIANYYHILE